MIVHFETSSPLSKATCGRPDTVYYGVTNAVSIACRYGDEFESLDVGALGLEDWRITLAVDTRSSCRRPEVGYTDEYAAQVPADDIPTPVSSLSYIHYEDNIASGDTISFALPICSVEAYKFIAGANTQAARLIVQGFETGEDTPSFKLSLPVPFNGDTVSVRQPVDVSTTLIEMLTNAADSGSTYSNVAVAAAQSAKASAARATADASAAGNASTAAQTSSGQSHASASSAAAYALQAQSAATVAVGAAAKLPDPTTADKDKVPVVDAQGKYKLSPVPGGSSTWGSITGDLEDQEDLKEALDGKVSDVKVNGASIVTDGVANVPIASANTAGVGKALSTYGIFTDNGYFLLKKASDSEINARSNRFRPIVPETLDYAVRSVLPNVTTIPGATSSFSLLDSSATTNAHCHTYDHTPSAQPTYTLPSVADTAVTHALSVKVHFSAGMTSAPVFLAPDGSTVVTPKGEYSISATSIVEYLCEYDSVAGWVVYALEVA